MAVWVGGSSAGGLPAFGPIREKKSFIAAPISIWIRIYRSSSDIVAGASVAVTGTGDDEVSASTANTDHTMVRRTPDTGPPSADDSYTRAPMSRRRETTRSYGSPVWAVNDPITDPITEGGRTVSSKTTGTCFMASRQGSDPEAVERLKGRKKGRSALRDRWRRIEYGAPASQSPVDWSSPRWRRTCAP